LIQLVESNNKLAIRKQCKYFG